MIAGLDTFAKVRALHNRTDNPGEKAAAAGRMEALARSAGMTVAEAMSKLDRPKPKPKAAPKSQAQATADAFNDFFNRPEMQAQRAEQDRKRQARRAEILARYGSVEAVYAETEREAALRVACEPMIIWDRRPGYEEHCTLDGWDWLSSRDKVPPHVSAAVSAGWPLPQTIAEAWAEYTAASEHERDRQTMHDYEHFPAPWADVRRYVVEDLLDTLPAASINEMLLRQSWLEHLNEQGFSRDIHRDIVLLATLRADIERMGARLREQDAADVQDGHDPDLDTGRAPTVQSGQAEGHPPDGHTSRRTNAAKRADVLALLGQGLTDREIARRAGVSPQTVGNIRKGQT